MQTRTMRNRAAAVAGVMLAAIVMLASGAAFARVSAQTAQADARWQPWLGCWEPVGAGDDSYGRMLCVLPAEGTRGVDLASVDSGQVLARERVVANGQQMNSDQGGCKGWKSATWSPNGAQLYLKSDFDCEGLNRKSTGIFAMAPGGIWLDVQGVSAKDGGGVRVIRYRPAQAPDALRDELARVTAARELSLSTARTAVTGDVSVKEVVDASHAVDPSVVEAWLIERGQKFDVDSKQLVQLADAGVPNRVIDAMVALSYPKQFAIAGTGEDIGMRSGEVALQEEGGSGRVIHSMMMYPYGYGYYGFSPFDYFYSPYGYSPYYGYGLGYGWYPSGVPVVIIRNPNDVAARQHGRVVNGRGYVRGGSGSDGNSRGSVPRRTREDWGSSNTGSSTSRGGSTNTGSSVTSSPSSSGSQGTGRTAKPRKP